MFMNIDKLNLEMLKINYFEKDSGQADFKGIIIESNPSKLPSSFRIMIHPHAIYFWSRINMVTNSLVIICILTADAKRTQS